MVVIEAAINVRLALLGTLPSYRHGKMQILKADLCQEFYVWTKVIGWTKNKAY